MTGVESLGSRSESECLPSTDQIPMTRLNPDLAFGELKFKERETIFGREEVFFFS